jgi:hypothetical protein
MLLFAAGTGVLVFCWSRRLFDTGGAFLSLALFALCPNFLAHGALATSDAAAVFFLLAASGAWWRHLRQPTWRTGALSALTFGFAFPAKYSAVLLLPVFALLFVWRFVLEDPAARRRWWRIAPLTAVAHAAAAWAVIWTCYGWRYSAFAPGLPPADHFIVPWEQVLPFIGWHGKLVQLCRDGRLLPEAWLYGYAWVIQSAKARSAFLAGDYSIVGWASFFPLAFLWKTPLALLGGLAVGAGVGLRRWFVAGRSWRDDLAAVAPLLVLFVVYWAFALASHLNIGHRHILPTYPVLFILLGGLVAPGGWLRPWGRAGVGATLVLGQAAASASVHPHYLAFFNTLAGGPANGWRLLVDSSLDWGQDLPALRAWLGTHNSGPGRQPVFLSYFGSGEPDYYGLSATRLPFVNGFMLERPWYRPGAGLYCVSATMLQQVYSPMRGAWTAAREQEYQALRALDATFEAYGRDPAARARMNESAPAAQWRSSWQRYDLLRFARLCHYLRARRPEAVVGHTFFIHRLTEAEVGIALHRPYSELLRAVEAAARR